MMRRRTSRGKLYSRIAELEEIIKMAVVVFRRHLRGGRYRPVAALW